MILIIELVAKCKRIMLFRYQVKLIQKHNQPFQFKNYWHERFKNIKRLDFFLYIKESNTFLTFFWLLYVRKTFNEPSDSKPVTDWGIARKTSKKTERKKENITETNGLTINTKKLHKRGDIDKRMSWNRVWVGDRGWRGNIFASNGLQPNVAVRDYVLRQPIHGTIHQSWSWQYQTMCFDVA